MAKYRYLAFQKTSFIEDNYTFFVTIGREKRYLSRGKYMFLIKLLPLWRLFIVGI